MLQGDFWCCPFPWHASAWENTAWTIKLKPHETYSGIFEWLDIYLLMLQIALVSLLGKLTCHKLAGQNRKTSSNVLLLTTQFMQWDHRYRHRWNHRSLPLVTSYEPRCSRAGFWHLISGPNAKEARKTHGSRSLAACYRRFVLPTTAAARLIALTSQT